MVKTDITDITTVARDPRAGGYECDRRDARDYARALRDAGFRVRLTARPGGRTLLTWRAA